MKIKKATEKQALVEEMGRVMEYMKTVNVGSDEYDKARKSLIDLADKVHEIDSAQKDRWVRIVEFGVKTAVIGLGTVVAYKFEEKGTILTTDLGKGVVKNFIPKW